MRLANRLARVPEMRSLEGKKKRKGKLDEKLRAIIFERVVASAISINGAEILEKL